MSNNSDCALSASALDAAEILEFSIYRVINLIYLIVGTATNLILLLAFYKQSKTEKAYGYQVIFTISKTLEILAFGTYLLPEKWFYPDRLPWLITNYGLMFYYNIGLGLHVSFIISTLLLSIAMAADRVFALVKPILYKNINHFRHQTVASAASFFLAFFGGSMYFADMKLSALPDGTFQANFDNELEHSPAGHFFFCVRLFLRVGGVVALFVLNAVMIVAFKKYHIRVASMTSRDSAEQKRLRSSERMLLWLNIYQAFITLANQLPHVSWQVLLFFMPGPFESCEGRFIGAICDCMLMITDTADFFIVWAISKKMQKLIADSIPAFLRCQKKKEAGKETVVTIDHRVGHRFTASALARVN